MSTQSEFAPQAHPAHGFAGKLAYATLFVVVLPLLLLAWAHRLDQLVNLPAVGSPAHGLVLGVAGAVLMLAATIVLRIRGGGWPMSPFPPSRRVTAGPYSVVRNPIYAGACLLAAGVAVYFASPAGIWVVAPVLALACAAFVAGYEQEATDAHFGAASVHPLLRLPAGEETTPALADRLSIYVLVFLPWLVAFEAVNTLGVARDALRLGTAWDDAIPVVGWTEPIYFLAYPMILALPLVIRSSAELRRLAVRGWFATVAIATIYLIFPTSIDAKPVPAGEPFAPMLLWERAFDDHSTGFPAFHVVWILVAAAFYSRALPRFRMLWWSVAIAISISCVTTGMHVVLDVLAALVAAPIVMHVDRVWHGVLRASEWIAGTWREWDLGAIRFLSHGLYAAAGGFFGIVLVGALVGPREILAAGFVAFCAIVGAGLWAQFIEGSPALLRPYGFYGGLIGGTLAIAVVPLAGADGWLLLGAFAVATPVVQAWGRVRCLIQGCCHGRPCAEDYGIRFFHPRSRVTRLAGLGGHPVHPTQTYSIVWCAFMFLLLARLWEVAAPLSFVAGAFFILNGLGRFVEEHFRGEPQTPLAHGLHIYQWLAIGSVVIGGALSSIETAAAPPASLPSPRAWLVATAVGVFAQLAYGVDFPRLNRRFSRLV